MDRLRKVSESCQALLSRGLLGRDEAWRVALVSALSPTLEEETLGSSGRALLVAEEDLLRAFGLQGDEVQRHVQHLQSVGLPIESVAGSGYRFERRFDDLLIPEAVLSLLLEQVDLGLPWAAGLPYRYLPHCASTSEVLKQEAARSPAGTAVVTDEQTAGRGRLGRSWLSGAGQDLTFSVLLRPPTAAGAPILSLAAALAVAEVLEEIPGLAGKAWVKWPNDVLLGDRKVCGILLEGCLVGDSAHWAVAGIGLNVNSDPRTAVGRLTGARREEWQGKLEPTSLRSELGRELARGALLVRLLMRLTQRWVCPGTEDLLDGLRSRDWLRGRRVEVLSGPPDKLTTVAGQAVGIGAKGELLVRDDSGCTVPVFGGEVTVSTRA